MTDQLTDADRRTELRFQTYTGEGIVLDEVVGEGLWHLENLTDATWYIGGPDVQINAYIDWLPLKLWWDEIRMSWWSWRLPCFKVIRLRVIYANDVDATLDGDWLNPENRVLRNL